MALNITSVIAPSQNPLQSSSNPAPILTLSNLYTELFCCNIFSGKFYVKQIAASVQVWRSINEVINFPQFGKRIQFKQWLYRGMCSILCKNKKWRIPCSNVLIKSIHFVYNLLTWRVIDVSSDDSNGHLGMIDVSRFESELLKSSIMDVKSASNAMKTQEFLVTLTNEVLFKEILRMLILNL